MRSRDDMAELDAEIAREDARIRQDATQAATQAAVLKMAAWALGYWPRKTTARDAFFTFLKREFGLVGKACTKCDQWKPRIAFGKNKSTPDGIQHQCKACFRELHQRPEIKAQRRRAVRKYRQKLRDKAD